MAATDDDGDEDDAGEAWLAPRNVPLGLGMGRELGVELTGRAGDAVGVVAAVRVAGLEELGVERGDEVDRGESGDAADGAVEEVGWLASGEPGPRGDGVGAARGAVGELSGAGLGGKAGGERSGVAGEDDAEAVSLRGGAGSGPMVMRCARRSSAELGDLVGPTVGDAAERLATDEGEWLSDGDGDGDGEGDGEERGEDGSGGAFMGGIELTRARRRVPLASVSPGGRGTGLTAYRSRQSAGGGELCALPELAPGVGFERDTWHTNESVNEPVNE